MRRCFSWARLGGSRGRLASLSLRSFSSQGKDTIFALSSGAEGVSGVAVLRISGPRAAHCLKSLTRNSAAFPEPRVATLRHLVHPLTKDVLDHAMVLWFPNPRSFTGEDVCELHVHGSKAVIKGVFAALTDLGEDLNRGAEDKDMSDHVIRLAERGEFTKRAFENGKLDLTEAEGLGDLLMADTSAQRKQALRQMEGHMRRTYETWRDELKSCLAHCEAVIDFGDDDREDDIDDSAMWSLSPKVQSLCTEMKCRLNDKYRGEIIRDGVRVALIGPPNAGKSSLLNLLSNRPAAIVSPIAGTTRDIVEVRMDIDGIACIVSDTAGIRINHSLNELNNESIIDIEAEDIFSTTDPIEREGMRRARDAYCASHVKIVMCDSSDLSSVKSALALLNVLQVNETDENMSISNSENIVDPDTLKPFIHRGTNSKGSFNRGNIVVIFNKSDLIQDPQILNSYVEELNLDSNSTVKFLSCSTGCGLQEVETALKFEVRNTISDNCDAEHSLNGIEYGEGELITRSRHRSHIVQCVKHLESFLEEDMLMDTAAEELRLAMMELGKLTGRVEVEELLDVIFRDFCIGK